MSSNRVFSQPEAKRICEAIGVNWEQVRMEEFRVGLAIELEHGVRDPDSNVTNNDELLTGKIA